MHLKRVVVKGFKSFPDRTSLAFDQGVSVIVGPNGSGKSNVTDAVLWAMGEQSPLAVRGASMQDVIFAGGHGRTASQVAEVELVLDNSDGSLGVDFAEVSVLRRLDRAGEGEYRVNGARCRLVDVLELLSDTGLGKESHSVVSQGRVESIVTSKPRDRRLLIEEAAGLGKHRKRRRRAQLKLARTQENLDRALDVEREARSRLRPLKRQAEAAELHARLQRQSDEARWELARDALRGARESLSAAESSAAAARAARAESEQALADVARRRQEAEEALAARSERREALSQRAFAARAAGQRVEDRLEAARATERALRERAEAASAEAAALERAAAEDVADPQAAERIAALEAERDRLEADRRAELEHELEGLRERRDAAGAEVTRLDAVLAERREAVTAAEAQAEVALTARREAERAAERARAEAARVGAELAAVNQFLRAHAGVAGRSLADELDVEAGCELALSAALGGRLQAAVVDDRAAGAALLDRSARDGGSALVAGASASGASPAASPPGAPPAASPTGASPAASPTGAPPTGASPTGPPPCPGARPLADLVRGPDRALSLARRLLAGVWLVDDLDAVPEDFAGTAVTRRGRVWVGAWRELRQVPEGGAERVLVERGRRDQLLAETETAASAEVAAKRGVEEAAASVAAADALRDEAERAVRTAARERDVAAEDERRAALAIERHAQAPDESPARARIEAELAAEQRLAERAEREREERTRRIAAARARAEAFEALAPAAARLAEALSRAAAAIAARAEAFQAELDADRAEGETLAARLRACAQEEAAVQDRLRREGEAVTTAEVAAQRARDTATEVEAELRTLAERLGLEVDPAAGALADEEREALAQRVERLARRREQLGPVNPLAQEEYKEALAHVEELEHQRSDLETALRELADLIRDTDRQIRETFEETFEAAARNFGEIVEHLFPGGRGALRLVREDAGPRPVLGGQDVDEEAEADVEAEEDEDELLGVEIEITPAGKAMKRLSLLSGGEKSLTALAFIFSVFLARPCPFYILDEVEAALDDLNIDRFLVLLRRYAERAQFIVVTHQKRTMEAADVLYGVSMSGDGISKVVSRRLPPPAAAA